jgi:hypothetical protein
MSPADSSSDGGVPSSRLAVVSLSRVRLARRDRCPDRLQAPGAARQVVAHCLARLVAPRIVYETQLLVRELVTNSVRHGDLDDRDSVFVRIYLAAESLRLEIENPGVAGVVAVNRPDLQAGRGFGLQLLELVARRWGVSRGQSTTVWFEMARA